ncbi:MAG TPA: M20/M25/M40 family metallo-hydrolase, partial [Candidatus Sulfopaludibacter sp.]|nr:M20/M25/M40 family metallo-hydrolase [Candidatus Sulfopaludibacter sp.]
NLLSSTEDPVHGIGAARQWIFDEFKGYSPRLQVRFDKWRVKKQGQRIFKDVDVYNVVAVLPGKTIPDTQILISGHYDSLNLGARQTNGPPATGTPATLTPEEFEKNANLPAPGACDDGSGTAAVMELARVMSQYEFDKTLVFVAFAGEEQGLVGSTLEAARARSEKWNIEAVLNNDIIGTEVSGNGRIDNSTVSVYSDEIQDSPNQQLARLVREMGERYVPSMKVKVMFMGDRLGRGGDHTPFQLEGFAAVRISTPNENYTNQHTATDLLENMSVPYTTRVARINGAAAASLALAPAEPAVMPAPRAGAPAPAAGAPARVPTPMITRGTSRYDAQLRWRTVGPETNLKGFAIVVRPTTSAFWEQEIFVGKVNEYTLKDVSIDDARFGVKAIGMDGTESLVVPYIYPARKKAEYETIQ